MPNNFDELTDMVCKLQIESIQRDKMLTDLEDAVMSAMQRVKDAVEVLQTLDDDVAKDAIDILTASEYVSPATKRNEIAQSIMRSEPMMWLMVGANHPEAHFDALRPAWRKWIDAGGKSWGKG